MTAPLEARRVAYGPPGGPILVHDIDLTIASGEVVAVVGPNGAGKTTLLRLLAGDLAASTGTVAVMGDSVPTVPIERLALRRAMLAQRTTTDVPFTVGDVVAMGRHPHRRDAGNSAAVDHATVRSAMERTDVAHLEGRTFATLSGGEQTRVSLARVLAQDTPIVLLDEPTDGLDLHHQEQVMAEVARLGETGKAVVAVLHDLNHAARRATRIIVLHRGSAVADGPPGAVLTDRLLSDVYRQPIKVVPHPFRDCPLVLTTGT